METMILKGGLVFVDKKIIMTDILLSKGKIEKIGKELEDKKAKVIDCKGKLILPGVIDSHVHFREPGMTQKEDFSTGSQAAAAGGVTTVLDMPNTKPPTITVKELNHKRKIAAKKSVVNYGFHFGSSVDNLSEIKKAKNVASTKIFMNWSTGKMKIDDDKKLEEIFKASRFVSVHAEGEKVKTAVELAKKTKKHIYLCHISSRKELTYLKKNKGRGIYAEATPHHLYLSARINDPFRSVRPKLENKKDSEALWKAIEDGMIDTIGSDHAPHTIKEKEGKDPPSGMPGVETILPLMLNAVNKRWISLRKVVRLCCENPAKIFGISGKGEIKKGNDADIVVVDMHMLRKVDSKKLHTKCKWSAFNGKQLKGWPVMTIVNGNIVFDGKIYDKVKGKEVKFI